MANKKLKTLTLPNIEGNSDTYDLCPDWDKVEGKPDITINSDNSVSVNGVSIPELASRVTDLEENGSNPIIAYDDGDGIVRFGFASPLSSTEETLF